MARRRPIEEEIQQWFWLCLGAWNRLDYTKGSFDGYGVGQVKLLVSGLHFQLSDKIGQLTKPFILNEFCL